MSGLFNTLNVANKGLMTSQTALHTVGHNISNANTNGYSRQRVELQADLAFKYAAVGQLGSGVKMESIIRISNKFVARQLRQETSHLEKFSAHSEAIDQLEMIFNEPTTTGINYNISEMFDSWKELSLNPELSTSKTLVAEKSKTFADSVNYMQTQMERLLDETHEEVVQEVEYFNTAIDKLKTLNKQIYNVTLRGQSPNDLLDQRDLLLREVSGIADVEVNFDNYERVNIKLDKKDVLKFDGNSRVLEYEKTDYSKESGKLKLEKELNSDGSEVDGSNEIGDIEINSGSIYGFLDSIKDVNQASDELNLFAKALAEAVNTIHKGEEKQAIDFFKYDKDTKKLTVNEEIMENPSQINAGVIISDEPIPGDGSRALEISKLRHIRFLFDKDGNISNKYMEKNDAGKYVMQFEDNKNGKTIEDLYRAIVTTVGIKKEHSDSMIDNQEVVLEQLHYRRESESGVSLDEEVSDLIRFQSAYQANARVIQTIADMLDTLINRTGV